MARFQSAVELVLNHEGGYVKDPADRGGETKFGISKARYPDMDIPNLTRQDALDLYFVDFWVPVGGDSLLSQKVANVLLDFAVNAGVRRASQIMQRCVGVRMDGIIGPKSVAAINSEDLEKLALHFTVERIQFYSLIAGKRKGQRKFLAGWVNRAISSLKG